MEVLHIFRSNSSTDCLVKFNDVYNSRLRLGISTWCSIVQLAAQIRVDDSFDQALINRVEALVISEKRCSLSTFRNSLPSVFKHVLSSNGPLLDFLQEICITLFDAKKLSELLI